MKKLLFLLLFPFITYGQVQIGQDIDGEAASDGSGGSISLSSDGSIIAIAAVGNDGNGENSGHVRVYENQGGVWTQIGQDIDGEAANDGSGGSVSLSSDGSILAIAASGNDDNGSNSGHVRIYENQEDIWTQIGQDINGEEANDSSGQNISLSLNGNIIAIGAPGNNGNNGSLSGHVRIYENQEGIWTQIGQDIDGEAAGDFSGRSVSLSSDGSIIAIGGDGNDDNGSNSGHVRIYENQEGIWTQIGQDINGEAQSDNSGRNISLSSDGSIVAIDALNNSNISGHVRIYENQGGVWTQIGQDIDGEATSDASSRGLSLSSNGNIVAIGASGNDGNGSDSGHTRIYENQNGVWVQIGNDIDGESPGDNSGWSVSLSSNNNIAISALRNDGNGSNSGHVRIFDLSDLLSTEEFTPFTSSLYPNPASTQITIEIPQENTLENVTIYNSLGQLVLSSKNTTIDTSTLSKGMYIVEVFTNQGASSKKLIIE